MKLIIFYSILIANTFQVACSQNKGPISVEQVPSPYSTVLYANKDESSIVSVRFFLTLDITNNTNEDINIGIPEYINGGKYLKDLFKGWRTPMPIYFNYNDKFEIALDNKNVEGLDKLDKTPKQYIFPTSHIVSQDSTVQPMFTPYLEKMKIENKDTLHIGTISELKVRNSPIVEMLEGDTIFLYFDRENFYIGPIPVQIK